MKKKLMYVFICILLLTCTLSVNITTAYGKDYLGVYVYAYIQGHDRELAQGGVYAYTFKEAIQQLSSNNNINIVFSHEGAKSGIYSVNNIKNGFIPDGGWHGYIIRGGSYLKPDEYLDMSMENGDEIVLYYGNANETKIITDFTLSEENGTLTFRVSTAYTLWSQGSGKWEKDMVDEKLSGVNIHLIMPGGSRKILKTSSLGIASTKVSKLGVYKYYAESYVSGGLPLVVRTTNNLFIYGVKDEENVTRAEAAAFLVNLFGLPDSREPALFSDVSMDMEYGDEIYAAAGAGIISGFSDNTFRPEEPVNQLQMAVMLSKVYDKKSDMTEFDESELPKWAVGAISPAVYYNILSNMDIDWFGSVTKWMLQQIYLRV